MLVRSDSLFCGHRGLEEGAKIVKETGRQANHTCFASPKEV